MPEPQNIRTVTLDDADLEKRNEALLIENDILKEELLDTQEMVTDLARRVEALYGVQAIGALDPEQVRKLYAAVEAAIEAFVGPMDRFIRDNSEHRDRVMAAMSREGSAKAFRSAIGANEELKAAAVIPETCVIDIWTAYIWRFLLQQVFSEPATLDFYSDAGQNASYYIKNLNEIEHLMTQADPPVFGLYSRRLWKRQALSAIFRTANFAWIESNRTAKTDALSQNLLRAFQVFARPFAQGRALQLAREVVAAAVRLNEHVMIEADDLWTIELEGVAGGGGEDDFYDRLEDFDLKPVGTAGGLRDNAPLDGIKRRLGPDVVRERVRRLCVLTPALRYRHIGSHGDEYGDPVHVVRPQVLVALAEITPLEVRFPASLGDELVFYTMAKSLGLVEETAEGAS